MWPQAILERATDHEGKPLRDRLKVGRGAQVLQCSAVRAPLCKIWACTDCDVTRGLRCKVSKVWVLQSQMDALFRSSPQHKLCRCFLIIPGLAKPM